MTDEKQLLPISGLDTAGIVKDVSGHILAPNVWTNGKNVFFKNGGVNKRKGSVKAIPDVSQVTASVTAIGVGTGANTGKITFNKDVRLVKGNTFSLTGVTPSVYNTTFTVFSVDPSGKIITIEEAINNNAAYSSGGTYSYIGQIDFFDYWPIPGNEQYIEVQRNTAVVPATTIINSINSSGTRTPLIPYENTVTAINKGTGNNDATVTLTTDDHNLKVGETFNLIECNPEAFNSTATGALKIHSISADKKTLTLSTDISSVVGSFSSGKLIHNQIAPTDYAAFQPEDWQSTLFDGGRLIVLNNGYHTPQYIETQASGTFKLRPLPGWDWQKELVSEPYHIGAKVVRSFKSVLIAGNLSQYPISAGIVATTPELNRPGSIRISTTGANGLPPSTWQPGLTTEFADEFDLATTSPIVDIVPLQGSAIIYTTDSIHQLRFDSKGNASVQIIADGYGAIDTGCVIEYDGKHLVIGQNDIYIFSGHPGTIKSACELKVREYFFNRINPIPGYLSKIFMIKNPKLDEIQIYYPTVESPTGECDEYLAWNYRNNTWSINSVSDSVVTGTLANVRGGGVAGGTITFAGTGTTADTAQPEIQTITTTLANNFSLGASEVQTLDYSSINSTAASVYDTDVLGLTFDNNIIPFQEEKLEVNINNNFNTGLPSRTIPSFTSNQTATDINDTNIDVTISNSSLTGLTATGSGAGSNTGGTAGANAATVFVTTTTGLTFASGTTLGIGSTLLFQGNGQQAYRATFNGTVISDSIIVVLPVKAAIYYDVYIGGNTASLSTIADATNTSVNTGTLVFSGITAQQYDANGSPLSYSDFITYTTTTAGTSSTYTSHSYSFTPNTAAGFGSGVLNVTGGNSGNVSNNASYTISNMTKNQVVYTVAGISSDDNITVSFAGQGSGNNLTSNGSKTFTIASPVNYTVSGTVKEPLISGTGTQSNLGGFAGLNVTTASISNGTRYTLTNNSTTSFSNISFQVNDKISSTTALSTGSSAIVDVTGGNNESFLLSLGVTSTFALSGTGVPSAGTNIPLGANVSNVQAATLIKNYINQTINNSNLRATSSGDTVNIFFRTATAANLGLSFTANGGSNITSSNTNTAPTSSYTRWQIQGVDSENNQVFLTTVQASNSIKTAAQIATAFSSAIQTAASSLTPAWTSSTNNNVVTVQTGATEDYALLITDITPNASETSGYLILPTLTSTLTGGDSSDVPDSFVLKDPTGATSLTIGTTLSGESIDSIMTRINSATISGWTTTLNTTTDSLVFTAATGGRYTGGAASTTYPNFGVFEIQYTTSSQVNSTGNIPASIKSEITTPGSDSSVQFVLFEPVSGTDQTLLIGGSTASEVSTSLASKISSSNFPNWTASANNNVVTITANASDWVLKDRTGITYNDTTLENRALYVKSISYPTGTTGSDSSLQSGTFTAAQAIASGSKTRTQQTQIGHPTINPSTATLTVTYNDTTTQTASITLANAGTAAQLATSLATTLTSSVNGISGTASNNDVTVTTSNYGVAIDNITVTFDEQSTSTNRNRIDRSSSGNNLGGSTADDYPTASLSSLSTRTDPDRPWAVNSFNTYNVYPVIATKTQVYAQGFGYKFAADPTVTPVVAGSDYESFVERLQMPLSQGAEYTASIGYTQIFANKGNVNVKVETTDSPGLELDMSSVTAQEFKFNEEYKLDTRIQGRLVNIRISDATSGNPLGWKVSGYGFKLERQESRGKS